ncbi:MAG: hypothetical protein HS111_04685 [Kofleriaceae bacterium]|nr:hypothetical protein [Kofleriaceae bacterium]
MVVLATALLHGPSKKSVTKLSALLGISRRTLVRWRRWWSTMFPTSRFWTSLRGRFVPAADEATMPASLLSRMTATDEPAVVTLPLVAPMSTRPWLKRALREGRRQPAEDARIAVTASGVEVVAERDHDDEGLDDAPPARAVGEPAPRDHRRPARSASRRGELRAALEALAAQTYTRPITGEPVQFAFSTVERWLHRGAQGGGARRHGRCVAAQDPHGRRHATGSVVGGGGRGGRTAQAAPTWSWLHADNLVAMVALSELVGHVPSYTTVRRLMKERMLFRQKRRQRRGSESFAATTAGDLRVAGDAQLREQYVHGLWHLDFHGAKFVRVVLANVARW